MESDDRYITPDVFATIAATERDPAAADAAALQRELTELRALPRAVLRVVSTRLTMAATQLAAGGLPDESAAALHTARLLYVLAREHVSAPGGTTSDPPPA